MKKGTFLSFLFCLSFLGNLFATHNAAGYIAYKQLDDNTVEASIITYTNAFSVAASRDSLLLCWGDGNCEMIARINGPDNNMNGVPDGEPLDSFFYINIYTAQHIYSAFGDYTLSMTDPNRNGGILNVNFPNSDMVPFHIETWFNLGPLNGGTNQSPVILEPPIIRAFVGLPYTYTPNAFDIDGDSVVYKFGIPMQNNQVEVPNYQFPCEINGNPPDQSLCLLNAKTGIFQWVSPQVAGTYVIVFLIESYRGGELIGQMILDFMVIVEEDPGLIPEIALGNVIVNAINPVNVGDTILMDIFVSDPNINDEIEINSSSGLYDYLDNPATFEAVTNGNTGSATFEWIVLEEHVRQQPYQVVIKANDNDEEYAKTLLVAICFQFEDFITSVKQVEKALGIVLYPNPVYNDIVNLKIENQNADFKQFFIYNSLGQLIKTGQIISNLTQINVQEFEAGVYFLQTGNAKNRIVKPFVVN